MSFADPMRFALIGFGRWGERYAEAVDAVGARVSQIATHDPERRRRAAARAAVVDDWRAAVESRDCDAVIVAAPPSAQPAILRACLAARKPVVLEKPLCLDAADARAIDREVRAAGVPVLVDHTLLFNPAYERLRRDMTHLGALRFIASEGMSFGPFRADPPTVWDWGPHDVACCLDLVAQAPSAVRLLDSGGASPVGADLFALRLDFPGGVTAWIHSGRASLVRRRSVSVFCAGGALRFTDGPCSALDRFDVEWDARHTLPSTFRLPEPTPVMTTDERPLTRMLHYFIEGVTRGGDTARFGATLAADVVAVLSRAQQEFDVLN